MAVLFANSQSIRFVTSCDNSVSGFNKNCIKNGIFVPVSFSGISTLFCGCKFNKINRK